MTRIRWTDEESGQLEAFVNRISEDNPEAARAVAQSILDRVEGLETFSGMGRPGEKAGTRELVSTPYVIAGAKTSRESGGISTFPPLRRRFLIYKFRRKKPCS